jgi:hypothetical protein
MCLTCGVMIEPLQGWNVCVWILTQGFALG